MTNSLTYDKLIDRSNSETSKLLLGSTMTVEVGKNGSRSQSEVHERVVNDVTTADKRFSQTNVNNKLFPVLQLHGWKVEGKHFEYPEVKGIEKAFARVRDLAPHVMFDIDWLNEKFGIKVVEQKLTKNDVENGKTETGKKKKKLHLTKTVEELYEGHFTS